MPMKAQSIREELAEVKRELRREQIKNLKLRMRISVFLTHPKSTAAEKITAVTAKDADFSSSIIHLN